MVKTLNNLYDDYKIKYNGNPKHKYAHFITILSKLDHHRIIIRPCIEWWQQTKK